MKIISIFLVLVLFSGCGVKRAIGDNAANLAKKQCEDSKLNIYHTAKAEGFYFSSPYSSSIVRDSLLDGSYKYYEQATTYKTKKLGKYTRYSISTLNDKRCQSDWSQKATKYFNSSRNAPKLQPDQCIAVVYSDEITSRYEYYKKRIELKEDTLGEVNKYTEGVKDRETGRILAEWIGYHGTYMTIGFYTKSFSCSYPKDGFIVNKVLLKP